MDRVGVIELGFALRERTFVQRSKCFSWFSVEFGNPSY